MLQLWNGRVLLKQLTDCLHERSLPETKNHTRPAVERLSQRALIQSSSAWPSQHFHNTACSRVELDPMSTRDYSYPLLSGLRAPGRVQVTVHGSASPSCPGSCTDDGVLRAWCEALEVVRSRLTNCWSRRSSVWSHTTAPPRFLRVSTCRGDALGW